MKRILITGSPGVGKTTLIKKIAEKLISEGITCKGFYTEEIRQNNSRIGFDIVTLAGNRAPLARKSSSTSDERLPRVGQYVVYINEFEKLALPVVGNTSSNGLLVIDEIGKMELFSKKFKTAVTTVMKTRNLNVMATVPEKSNILLITQLKEDKDIELITVTPTNRNSLEEVLLQKLISKDN
ncbi:unnamed protein product [Acanthoscelides obtectus]|uniref:AAA+ ATPase domain-containing protein n=1 Tax=Acanthoscelides obtectus TaxID=200917 RepID=A0A9P0JWP7_ACAOB|nr:unnamed protein product [Acanthoscelides obtectus]CAK1646987.1 Cancer-related nucleoside-triphosphatase homolog [Acanthoscelides obtectus]